MIHITKFRKGFITGINSIMGLEETEDGTGIEMSILKIEKGWTKQEENPSGNKSKE